MGDRRHGEAAEQRARAVRGVQQSVAGRAGVEVRVGVDRQQREVGHGEEAVEESQGDQAREHEVVPHEAHAFGELLEHVPAVVSRRVAVHPERGCTGPARCRRRRPPCPNPTAPPKAAIRTPVMDGPIMRPACQGIEPSAIAFGRRSRSISWGMSAMRLGSSNARKALLSAASTSRCSMRASPKSVRANAADSVSGDQGLRGDQEPQAVDAVGQDAAEELEEDQRHSLRQAEIGQGHRIPADLPRHPGEGHVFRAVPEDVEDEPEPVEAVVPPLEGSERRQPGGLRGSGQGAVGLSVTRASARPCRGSAGPSGPARPG